MLYLFSLKLDIDTEHNYWKVCCTGHQKKQDREDDEGDMRISGEYKFSEVMEDEGLEDRDWEKRLQRKLKFANP